MTGHLVAGFDDVGYPGLMLPLGTSYARGQAALHYDIPSNPEDPGLPHDDWFSAFADAWYGDSSHSSMVASIPDLKHMQSLRDAWAAYKRNGVLPTDSEVDEPTSDSSQGWSSHDNILRQRFIYFYDSQANYGNTRAHGVGTGLDSTSAMYVQIQGYSASTHSWVLPRMNGQQVLGWRYSGGAPLGKGGASKWTSVFSFGQWGGEYMRDIAAGIISVAGAALAAFTAGASLGLAGVVVSAMKAMLDQAKNCALSGKSVDFFPVVLAAGQSLLKEAGPDLAKAVSRMPEMAQAVTRLSAMAAGIEKAIGNVDKYLDENVGKLVNGDFSTWIHTASQQAAKNGWKPQWDAAMQMVGGGGGLDQDGLPIGPLPSVGRFFMEQTKKAANMEELGNIFENAPWYAKGTIHLGAITRAVEIGGEAYVDPRTLSQGRRTGLTSARYINSTRGRAENVQAPILVRVTAPSSPKSLHADPPSTMAKAAIIAVPIAAGGGLFLKHLIKKGSTVLWVGGALALAGLYVWNEGRHAPIFLSPKTEKKQ